MRLGKARKKKPVRYNRRTTHSSHHVVRRFCNQCCLPALYVVVALMIASQLYLYTYDFDGVSKNGDRGERRRGIRSLSKPSPSADVTIGVRKNIDGSRNEAAENCHDDDQKLQHRAMQLGFSVDSCKGAASYCYGSPYSREMRQLCPKTCKVCTEEGSANGAAKSPSPEAKHHLTPLMNCGADAEMMAFWKSATERDLSYVSPFKSLGKFGAEEKYVSFEYDNGGWNNIRMAMETSLVLAMGMGRTLVLPPEAQLYLLNKDASWRKHSFDSFFEIQAIQSMYPDRIITFEEFLSRRLPDHIPKPKKSLQDLVRTHQQHSGEAYNYLRSIAVNREWGANDCAVFYDSPSRRSVGEMPQEVQQSMRRFCGSRTPRVYDEEMQNSFLVHFPVDLGKDSRLLAHFYAFVFFGDPEMDRWAKRFVRDSLHYKSQIFCQAHKVVAALMEESGGRGFNAFHIRRNDFQYKDAWLSVPQIMDVTNDVIDSGSLVYIATDEQNHAMFEPMRKRYNVRFLSDFLDRGLLKGVNKNWYGMIEQIVCSHADKFVGTWWSTFTGYINRMRGYFGRDKQSWYYPRNWKYEMQAFRSPDGQTGWWREWPTAWTDID